MLQDKLNTKDQTPEEVSAGLRNIFLTADPIKLGFDPEKLRFKVWGVLMETGYPGAAASLVCLRDGNASLYFSSGGGIIGGIGHEAVRLAAIQFVQEAEDFLPSMTPTKDHPYPSDGKVTFTLLTFDGHFGADAGEMDLGEGKDPLSPLFYSGHRVITQLRLISEKMESSTGNDH